jgi:hypothetical protein
MRKLMFTLSLTVPPVSIDAGHAATAFEENIA